MMGRGMMSDDDELMGELERGTVQRAQLRARLADIAWSALFVLLALWVALNLAGVAMGWEDAWSYCAIGAVLLAVAWGMRVLALRNRARRRI